MTVAELRRFRAYRNMILAHGMTELYHETEYNHRRGRVYSMRSRMSRKNKGGRIA